MSILKKLFQSKDEPQRSYSDFWAWFQNHEKEFFTVIKNKKDIEKNFFNLLAPKLGEIKEGIFYVTGMYDDQTVELILTADGNTRNIAFVEELVENAPFIKGWKFTALKPSLDITDVSIEMNGYEFNSDNLHFYAQELPDYPDEIDITLVHADLTPKNKEEIVNGVYIFLDNYLGELDFLNNIDNLTIVGPHEAQKKLISIEKIKDYLTWRQKEFVEKYEGVWHDTENDTYSIIEGELNSGNYLVAVINTELLTWDSKASHPWISVMTIKYDGSRNNGMPQDRDYKKLEEIEEEALKELKDMDGYLNIGRQTADGEREIYFACKDFREPSKVFYKIQQQFSADFEIEYDLYKDKYWQSFERFNN